MKKLMMIAVLILPIANVADAAVSQDDERMFYVQIAKGTELSGQIIDVTELSVSSSFGDITIPIEKIEAVKMHAGNDDSAVIAFTNGDMVTGKIDLAELNLKTGWGKAFINAESIDSLSTSRYGRFYNDPNAGGWRFSRGNPAPNTNNNQFGGQMRGTGNGGR